MTTSRTILVVVAGLLAGAIGFYAGLFVLLAITGLDSPSWAPLAQLTGSAAFMAAAVSLAADLALERAVGFTVALTATGAVAGLVIMALDLDFEAAIIGALLLVAVATLGVRSLDQPDRAATRQSSDAAIRAG